MAQNWFRPKPGRYNIMVSHYDSGLAGTITPNVGASATTIYRVATPRRKVYVELCSVQCNTLAAGSAAITVQFFIRNSVGSKSVALTGTFDIKGMAQNTVLAVPITATDPQRFLQESDYLAYDIVAAGTVTTQPTDFFSTVEVGVIE